MFSVAFLYRVVKSRDCVVKNKGIPTLKIVFFFNRVISVISVVLRETTVTVSDSTVCVNGI